MGISSRRAAACAKGATRRPRRFRRRTVYPGEQERVVVVEVPIRASSRSPIFTRILDRARCANAVGSRCSAISAAIIFRRSYRRCRDATTDWLMSSSSFSTRFFSTVRDPSARAGYRDDLVNSRRIGELVGGCHQRVDLTEIGGGTSVELGGTFCRYRPRRFAGAEAVFEEVVGDALAQFVGLTVGERCPEIVPRRAVRRRRYRLRQRLGTGRLVTSSYCAVLRPVVVPTHRLAPASFHCSSGTGC